ncbi:MAG TPA: flagellar biosynthetic protein FliO [Candidatus Acidoferrum sp.]|nr:flagellar biosynthetic protein FliO [Candidatus Acidoferrum sp.]
MSAAVTASCRLQLVAAIVALSSLDLTAATNSIAVTATPLPGVGGSFVRMMAGLAFVLALFFGGVWLFKNWQRVSRVRNHSKLNIFEARSLGPRQALYVVGYNQQRFLVGASPSGIALISALPEAAVADAVSDAVATPNGTTSFAQVLQSVLGRK